MLSDCVFCKIISKKIPSKIIKETDNIIVIKDIAPKAPIHYLIIPKKHFPDLFQVDDSYKDLLGEVFVTAKDLSSDLYVKSFKLVVNNGKEAGQCVFHFHMHFLSGRITNEV